MAMTREGIGAAILVTLMGWGVILVVILMIMGNMPADHPSVLEEPPMPSGTAIDTSHAYLQREYPYLRGYSSLMIVSRQDGTKDTVNIPAYEYVTGPPAEFILTFVTKGDSIYVKFNPSRDSKAVK